MKEKLSVLAILVCCISLLAGCNNHQKKVNQTVEVDAIEKPAGMFYVFELKQDNNKVKLTFDSEGQLIE